MGSGAPQPRVARRRAELLGVMLCGHPLPNLSSERTKPQDLGSIVQIHLPALPLETTRMPQPSTLHTNTVQKSQTRGEPPFFPPLTFF